MSSAIFKCDYNKHNFSTDDIKKYDKHYEDIEHEYYLRVPCATGCGEKLHIKVKQKLSVKSRRIPRGYMCKGCREKVPNVVEIKKESKD